MALEVGMRLCVGNLAVPGRSTSVEVVPDGAEPEVFEVFELDLTSREGDQEWLERALGLPSKAFRRIEWPLLEEARAFLQTRRATVARRAGKLPNLGSWFDWRGRRVLLRNNVKALRVCFEKGEEADGVRWLLAELRKDCGTGGPGGARPGSKPETSGKARLAPSGSSGPPAASVAALEAEALEEVLADLRARPGVLTASFCPSREALLIRGEFGPAGGPPSKRFFGVPALKRQRKSLGAEERSPEDIRGTFAAAFRSAARAALEAIPGLPPDPAAGEEVEGAAGGGADGSSGGAESDEGSVGV